ncbi:CBM_collapsed_G0045350.mRNA.1.CDS.1 [Saccharomyces cerevisiae]|nr:AEL_HP2_G0039860.mRNA.1.CDS.1 [Saccharomyces cerevisiae]CAI6616576.1 AEL_HP2_G0039860.mRNA.1.CDS.1 [Saccharomyces cerevisiae]CAI6663186.1 AEL_HP1_G0042210.mRNA.1.CDS.1 [Saccharomyces cerevisiae]CAI7441715.1 CBM_collapsed_G0045350.mRNA.1.CDS.1 [Saccharomyces cerevisiae]
MTPPHFFLSLIKKRCICWICLEESTYDSTWLQHTCGCNLQIHKRCYIRWLYQMHVELFLPNTVDLPKDADLPIITCLKCLVDGHHDFMTTFSLTEIWETRPIWGQKSVPFQNDYVFNLMSLYTKRDNHPPYVLVKFGECPQCKKTNFIKRPTVTIQSSVLSLFYQWQKITRYVIPLGITSLFLLNPEKTSFDIGLWQLRCLFPENVLRNMLNISTTKALDVYAQTERGLLSIPLTSSIIIYGFIHYLSNISNVSANAILFKWVYLSIVKTAGNKYYKGIGLPKIILYSNLATFCYNFTFKRLVDLIYRRLINKGGKYLYHGNFENSSNSVPAEEFFIRRNWYAILAEKILWPFVGKCTGGLLLNAFLWIQRKFKIEWTPNCSPSEFRMIFNIIGCGTAAISWSSLKLYASYKRCQELEKINEFIEQSCKGE